MLTIGVVKVVKVAPLCGQLAEWGLFFFDPAWLGWVMRPMRRPRDGSDAPARNAACFQSGRVHPPPLLAAGPRPRRRPTPGPGRPGRAHGWGRIAPPRDDAFLRQGGLLRGIPPGVGHQAPEHRVAAF